MSNIIIRRGMKSIRTPEQLAEIEKWKTMTEEDIDYSDIPPLTEEELAKFRPARLRQKNSQNVAS